MNSAVNRASVALTARRLIIRLLTLVLIVSTLSTIVPLSASAATITATGLNANFCNQTVDEITGVTAERIANGDWHHLLGDMGVLSSETII